MTATIYYFSGTGNSLHAAKSIAEETGGTLSSIAGLMSQQAIEDHNEAIGLVFPVHCYDAPKIVKEFLMKLKADKGAYIFCVVTCGGAPGKTFHTVDRLLKKNGAVLSSALAIEMPDNIAPLLNMAPKPEKLSIILKAADDELLKFIDIIMRKEVKPFDGGNTLFNRSKNSASIFALNGLYPIGKKLKADEKCNGCGICQKVCPVNNISRIDDTVSWGAKCTWCLACVNWCPHKAVHIGRWTKKSKRYNHPDITVKDMIGK